MARRRLVVFFILPLALAVSQTACQRMPLKVEGDPYPNEWITTGATPDPAEIIGDCTGIIRNINSECEPLMFTEFGTQRTEPTDHACAENSGRMERTSYLGWLTPDLVPVLVYLPPCYGDLNQRYPVLYLLHGKPQDEKHWQILGVEDVLESAYWDNTLPPFLVVMPLQPEPLFSSTDGGPGSYEAEFINGLIPFIDRTYRTIARGDTRGLAGVSLGGVWALEIGFRNSDIIQRVGALSPALNVSYARPEYDPFGLILHEDLPSKIFLMSGDTDSAYAKTLELSEALSEADIEHRYVLESGSHESTTWRWILPDLFLYLTVGW